MKRLFSLAVLVLLSITLSAQEERVSTSHGNVKGGARIGLSTSQISGDDLSGFHKFGVNAGLYATFPMTQNWKWMVQPELNFTMKGSHTYFTKGTYNGQLTYALNLFYLEVPVVFKWNFFKGFILEFGPQFGFNVFHQEKINGDIDEHVQNFRIWELSGIAGLSYLIKGHYGLYFRYANSFIPVRVPNNVFNRMVNKQFNSVIMVGFYYQF